LLEITNSLKPEYKKTRERKIDKKELERAIERKPGITLPELAKIFKCTKQAVHTALKNAKLTLKKRHSHTPKETPLM
jgi:transposase